MILIENEWDWLRLMRLNDIEWYWLRLNEIDDIDEIKWYWMRLMGLNELISNKSFVAIKNGLRINKNDRKQENLIKKMIKTMIGLGVNIFEPNPYGSFWIQKTLHNEHLSIEINEQKFISLVCKLLVSNKQGAWNENTIYQELIACKKNQC